MFATLSLNAAALGNPFAIWLGDLAVKGSLLFAAGAVVALLLAACRAPASVRHFGWLLAIMASIALPGLSLLLPQWTIRIPSLASVHAISQTQDHILAFDVASLPSEVLANDLGSSLSSLAPPSQSAAAAPLAESAVEQPSARPTSSFVDWALLVCYVWFFGAMLALSPVLLGLLQLRRLRGASNLCCNSQTVELLDELCRGLRIRQHIELRWSGSRQIPMIWGLWRPVLLLPTDAAHWSTDRLRAVLLHELAHLQRFDFVTQLLAQLTRALYWYNPLAWLAVSRLRSNQEQACDDRVLRTGCSAVDYAEHLLAIVTGSVGRAATPAVASAMARTSYVQRRLMAILDPRRSHGTLHPWMAALLIALMMTLAMPLAAAAVATDEQNNQKENDPQTKKAAETPADKQANERRLTERLLRLRQALAEHYITPPDDQQVLNGAIQGMLITIAYPFTAFLPADKLSDLQRNIDGKLTGIGAQLAVEGGEITVVTPLEGSPALASGVRPKDVILEINGQSTAGLELTAAVKKIAGPSGTAVTLKLRHSGGETADLTITRGPIVLPAVQGFSRTEKGQWQFMLDDEHKIGYVAVDQFMTATSEELRAAIKQLQTNGLKGMILDLRSCPGGLLSSAVEVAELFLPAATIVTLRGRESGEQISKSDGKKQLGDFPLVVLIDQRTSSAAEVLAGALQDNDRAVLLGTRTFGKGSVQTLIPLEDVEGAIRLTTAFYYLPSGRNIDRKPAATTWGIDPNDGYFFPLSTEAAEARGQRRQQRALLGQGSLATKLSPDVTPETIAKQERDPQLAAAMETMLAKLTTGEFKKIGQSAETAAKYAVSLDEVERRRGEALKKLHQLDAELKSIEQQAGKQP